MNIWASERFEDERVRGTGRWDQPDWHPAPVRSDRPAPPPAPEKQR